jgi:hypothetical protein
VVEREEAYAPLPWSGEVHCQERERMHRRWGEIEVAVGGRETIERGLEELEDYEYFGVKNFRNTWKELVVVCFEELKVIPVEF